MNLFYIYFILISELQTQNPKITFKKRKYFVGEWLEVNCTSGYAHPVPELTWLMNGDEVSSLCAKYQVVDADYGCIVILISQFD